MENIYDREEFFQEYARMDRSRGGLQSAGEWHQLKPLFPNMSGKSVLDLGCGYGWHCRYALEQGARSVLGIDLSKKMIEEAKKRNAGEGIVYQVCGIEEYAYPGEAFDLVISNLALHYIENLEGVYEKVHRTLREGGRFLFNIEHPTFTAGVSEDWVYDEKGKKLYWPVDNYFYPGERMTRFLGQKVKKQHHTLSQILNGLLKQGFCLETVEEAKPSETMLELPGMREEMRRPMMLLVRAKKKDKREL